MLAFFSNIFKNIEKKKPSDIVCLDFSKAFDTVPHDELLLKLWRIGITGSLWYWMKSYLSNRHHYTCICNSCSTRLPVRSGVPQGSVLGPLLFLLYINDLPESIHSAGTFMFADDTKLVKYIKDSVSQQLLQDDLNNLSTWCNTWSLALNPVKCSVLRVSLSPSLTTPPVYTILNVSLCSVCIFVKNDLTWSDHYNYISSKAYRSLNLIRRTISVSSSTKTKKSLYLSLVRSQLTYCSQLWRPNIIKDIKRLETIQRRATKFIMSNTSTSYRDRLQFLYILPLMYWLEIQDIMFLVKCLKEPSDNFNIFSYVYFSSGTTRSVASRKLIHNFTKFCSSRHFYFNRIVRLWNALPLLISMIPSLQLNIIFIHISGVTFLAHFDSDNVCSFHFLCPCNRCFIL